MKKWAIATLTASVIFSGIGTQQASASIEKVDFETAKQQLEGKYTVERVRRGNYTKPYSSGSQDFGHTIHDIRTDYVKEPQVKTDLVFLEDGLLYEDRRIFEQENNFGEVVKFNGKLDEITNGIFTVKEGRIIRRAAGVTSPYTGRVILDTERARQLYENDSYRQIQLKVKDGYIEWMREAEYYAFMKDADQLIRTSTSMKKPVILITNSLGKGKYTTNLVVKNGKLNTKNKKRIFAKKDSSVKYALKKGYVVADAKRFTGKLTLRPYNNSSEFYELQTLKVKKGLVKGLITKEFDKEKYGEALAKLSK
ncbi:hypothetical protein [Rummeliibacillus stabekisii]|uniref:hypothetical protein n=1 Tax=Rummeliibacillus stabekisii TaxID=241244 RepID=UPI00116769F3|nr:hypothetical protein [Rummeliibacillus stabekisii]MBB5168768.1 hypothetical protein [Rummeliibacillus stabekisii]GEL05092.1 hypothetical protein RST01_17190 [Rummeliibacillus stabekisii]